MSVSNPIELSVSSNVAAAVYFEDCKGSALYLFILFQTFETHAFKNI